jgi:hypothetical protein
MKGKKVTAPKRRKNPILKPETRFAATEHTVRRSPRARELKVAREQAARDALGELERSLERYVITKGQFSLIELIRAVLEQTGPADLAVSTWTAAGADIAEAHEFLTDGRLRSTRWLVDFTFQRRKPHFCGQLRKLFGDDAIRVTRNHAKLVVITNAKWSVTILTSMNLNTNPRMEFLLVREDPDLAAFNLAWIDDLFRRKQPGDSWARTPQWHKNDFGND